MDNTLFYGDNLTILRDRAPLPRRLRRPHLPRPALQLQPQLQRPLPRRIRPRQRRPDHRLRGQLALGPQHRRPLHRPRDRRRRASCQPDFRPRRRSRPAGPPRPQPDVRLPRHDGAPASSKLHRVLKPTGSLYLHCDPTASHYLKMLLDGIFGPWNFRNEITVWKRTNGTMIEALRAHCSIVVLLTKLQEDYTWKHPASPIRMESTSSSARKSSAGEGTLTCPERAWKGLAQAYRG